MGDFEEGPDTKSMHTVDFSNELYGYFIELLKTVSENDPKVKEALDAILKARIAFDIGTGSGNSALYLKKIAPNLEHIIAIDANVEMSPDVVQRLKDQDVNVINVKSTLQTYLATEGQKPVADIAMFRGVANHQLKPEDYQSLSEILSEDGVMIEMGDTNLSRQEMEKNFELAYGLKGDKVWKKNKVLSD